MTLPLALKHISYFALFISSCRLALCCFLLAGALECRNWIAHGSIGQYWNIPRVSDNHTVAVIYLPAFVLRELVWTQNNPPKLTIFTCLAFVKPHSLLGNWSIRLSFGNLSETEKNDILMRSSSFHYNRIYFPRVKEFMVKLSLAPTDPVCGFHFLFVIDPRTFLTNHQRYDRS